MDVILPYLIWAVLILVGLSLVAVLLFGLRGLSYGKANLFTVVSFVIPVVLFVALGLIGGDWVRAGMITLLIMLVLAALALLFTGVRGVFT